MIRKTLDLTQKDFGERIGIAQGYVTNLENSRREVNEKIIKLVCLTYKINENWLRTGTGEMFEKNSNSRLELALETFNALTPEFQDYVLEQIDKLLEIQKKEKDDPYSP